MSKPKEKYISTLPQAVLDEIMLYIQASAEIYGIVTLSKLVEIINSQNDYVVTDKDIKYVYKQTKKNTFVTIHERNIVHEAILIYDDTDYYSLLSLQKGKPYKIPEKSEFLEHADFDYLNLPQIYQKLRKYLVADVKLYRNDAVGICEDIFISMNLDYEPEEVYHDFIRREIYLTSEQASKILSITNECRNETPLWENRGYSYNELEKMGYQTDTEQQT